MFTLSCFYLFSSCSLKNYKKKFKNIKKNLKFFYKKGHENLVKPYICYFF